MIRGERGRIAFIWPDDGLNDDEFWAYLPDGVAWLTNRFPGTLAGHGLDRATFEASANLGPMAAAARMMRATRPDVVALGDHAGSFVNGIGHDFVQARALADAAGARHGTTPSTAMVEALRHLGARRLVVTSPYDEEVTAAGVAFLVAHDFEVLAVERVTFSDEHGIASQDAGVWLDAASRADRPEADAIALMGGGIRTAGMLPDLEARTGKPVAPATGATVWHACKLLGVPPIKLGMGRLFDAPSDPREAERLDTLLRRHVSSGTKSFAVTETPPVFIEGKGSWLTGADGRRYLDFACGSGTTSLGHRHPAIIAAIRKQIDRGITHVGPHFHVPVQALLLERLASLLPAELSVFHPATNGTEAMEAALKAAMHGTGNRRFLAFEGSYHGRTFGSLAVSHARGGNGVLGELRPETVHLPYPRTADDLALVEQRMCDELAKRDVAGVIVEPVQATAGMRTPHPGLLDMIRRLTTASGVAFILDEVFTGYGRTGRLFAFEQAGIIPDLLVLAKAASGGIPGALVVGRPELLKTWKPGVQSSTFQLHPLSAAASLATLNVIVRDQLADRALAIGVRLSEELRKRAAGSLGRLPAHGLGAMWGLEILNTAGQPDQPRTKAIRAAALEDGLITWECGTHGHVIGMVPPLTVTDDEIGRALAIMETATTRAR